MYPYFIFHYIFNKIILNEKQYSEIWLGAKPFSADRPHLIQFPGRRKDALKSVLKEIDEGDCPVYKLNWRIDVSGSYWSTVMLRLTSLIKVRENL